MSLKIYYFAELQRFRWRTLPSTGSFRKWLPAVSSVSSHVSARTQALEPSSTAFQSFKQRAMVVRRSTSRTRTGGHVGCQHCRHWLNQLRHITGRSALFYGEFCRVIVQMCQCLSFSCCRFMNGRLSTELQGLTSSVGFAKNYQLPHP